VSRVIRAELYKFRTTPGPWVVTGVVMLLTGLLILLPFALAGGVVNQTFAAPTTVDQLRLLLGAGYLGGLWVAPVLGVLCITTEYRHKVLTTSLLITPRREQVLIAKGIACVGWACLMAVASLVMVAAVGIPWLSAEGGSISALLDQAGAVVPALFLAYALLALYGLGIGTLLRNQIGAILITLGFTVIVEGIIVGLISHIFKIDLNWLPNEATRSLVGGLATGNNGITTAEGRLLPWWQGGLVLLAWGVVPTVIGYFTTFRRDVT
jgi:hypothetical protein